MSLTKCKECGGQVSSKAETCPHCGAKQPKKTGLLTWIIAGFFTLVVIQTVVGSIYRDRAAVERQAAEQSRIASLTPQQRKAESDKQKAKDLAAKLQDEIEEAAHDCKKEIEKYLKDPMSARWEPPWFALQPGVNKDGTVSILLQVRAKNSFGAFNIDQFDCRGKNVNGKFQAVKVDKWKK